MNPLVSETVGALTVVRINEWLESAVCTVSSFFEHIVTNRVICTYCYIRSDQIERESYVYTTLHYIHIGQGSLFETCEECGLVIPNVQEPSSCLSCHVALNDFVEYLHHTYDRPYDSSDPTVLLISVCRDYSIQ